MSACSSTDGSSWRLRKLSSVRSSPTPPTGPDAAVVADEASATFASSLTGVPSAVAPGPVHESRAARSSRSRATRRAASASSGSTSTRPVVPSSSTRVPAGISMAPVAPTTQGRPSWRAMIAVWLVGPPRSVTSPSTRPGSSTAVSEGARSSATSTDGSRGVGTPGSGSPTMFAITRRSMSRRSVARSAIRPPMLVNRPTNCSTAARTADTRSVPALSSLRTAERRPLSRARPALAVSTSVAAPVARAAVRVKPSATAVAASSYAARAVVGAGEVAAAEALDGGRADLAADDQGRTVGQPGNHGGSLDGIEYVRVRGRAAVRDHGHKLIPRTP